MSSVTYPLGHLLMMDIFYGAAGRKEPYLISVESRTGHIVTARLPAKTTNVLSTTIQDLLISTSPRVIQSSLYAPTARRTFLHVKTFFHAAHRHGVSRQASFIRFLKYNSHYQRATKFSLGWTLPRSLHQHLIVDVVQSMNDTVNVKSAPSVVVEDS